MTSRPGSHYIALMAWLVAVAPDARATVQIDQVPPYGVPGFLHGRVSGVDPATHRVAPYIYVDGFGWCTKPTFATPTVAIVPDATTPAPDDGTFTADVATGGIDDRATIYCAALLPDGVAPPATCGGQRIPSDLDPIETACTQRFGSELDFAGYRWGIKESPTPVGPGQNRFSDRPEDVFVDGQRLHLRVAQSGGYWRSTEVILGETLGYGTYEFTTESDLSDLDALVTFGAFLWDPHGDQTGIAKSPNRELDFEVSRWGDADDPTNAQWVVQPYGLAGNLERFTIPSSALRWRITWLPHAVGFAVFRDTEEILARTYTGPSLPEPGRAVFRFNLWINEVEIGGAAPPEPAGSSPAEVVVGAFSYVPEPVGWASGVASMIGLGLLARRRAGRGVAGERRARVCHCT